MTRPFRAPFSRLGRRAVVLALLASATLAAQSSVTSAAAIVVDTLADDNTANGNCTLREAIRAANENAAIDTCTAGTAAHDTITFSVAGTILTSSSLPTINGSAGNDTDGVTIDGGGVITVQRSAGPGPGLSVGRSGATTDDVVIRRITITGYTAQGLDVSRVTNMVVEDCVIHDNDNQGIRIQNVNTNGVTIRRCRIGVDGSGAPSGNGDDGIQINDGFTNITVEDSLLSANANDGIEGRGGGGHGDDLRVLRNSIGTDPTGTECGPAATNTFGNGNIGVDITGGVANSEIEDNVIGCNGRGLSTTQNPGHGIEISSGSSDGNSILDNYIGTNAAGANLGNHNNGIHLDSGVSTVVERNVIANNGAGLASTNVHNDGIHNDGSGTDLNRFSQNSIYNNGGSDPDGLGIDLNGDGIQLNDSNDTDSGPNKRMNYPLLTSAVWTAGLLQVSGCFDGRTGAPSEADFTLEFFCNGVVDTDGHGEGQVYAASTTLSADVGTTTYAGTPTCTTPGVLHSFLPPASCGFLSSTGRNTLNDTSEFGPNVSALSCSLSPDDATNILPGDTSHTVTARVLRGGAPVTGETVDFTVAGVNSVFVPDPSTDGVGVALFSYTSNGSPGSDTISATVTNAGETATCVGFDGNPYVAKAWATEPLAVEMTQLRATRVGLNRSVKIEWTTASEFKNAGFRVVRHDPLRGTSVAVTRDLVAPKGRGIGGANYTFVDWTPPATGLRYYVEDVSTDGVVTRHGPIVVGPSWERSKGLPGPNEADVPRSD